MLILNEQDLVSVLDMKAVIAAVVPGFKALSRGEAIVPERVGVDIPEHRAVMFNMPAAMRGALGTKIVSVFPGNRERNIEAVQSAYLLLDNDSGAPLALMEGRYITGIRTAATSAVATLHMAAPGAKRLSIFGAGVQSRFHIEAMLEVCAIESVLIASRSRENAARLADEIGSKHGLACEITSAERAASEANLICTCTTSAEPVFDGRLLARGAHINAVGAFTPDTREIDTETVLRSRIFIDAESAAGREAGDILIPLNEGLIGREHILGTLADVVTGRVAARRSPEDITLFKSCGLAVEDLVTARLAYETAVKKGIGQQVEL